MLCALREVEITGAVEISRNVHYEGLNPLDEKINIVIGSGRPRKTSE